MRMFFGQGFAGFGQSAIASVVRPVAICVVLLVGTALPATAWGQTTGEGAPGTTETIWAQRASLPRTNSEIAVADVAGKIYVVGGYPASRVYVDTVQVYDPVSDQWEIGVPLPQPMHHTVAASVDGLLYVMGGEVSSSGVAAESIFLNTVYAFDPATGVWTEKTPMPTPRSGGASAVIDGKIYVAGGRPPHGSDFAVYDPARDSWATLPEVPTQRNHLAAAAVRGKVYVLGGRFGGGVGSEMTDIVEMYDPVGGTWSRAASMPTVRAGVNGIAARGCIYVFGGEGNDASPSGVFPQNEVYDPRTDAWESLEPLPTPVHGVTGSAYLDGWIYLPGGGVARGGNSGSTLHQVFRAVKACE